MFSPAVPLQRFLKVEFIQLPALTLAISTGTLKPILCCNCQLSTILLPSLPNYSVNCQLRKLSQLSSTAKGVGGKNTNTALTGPVPVRRKCSVHQTTWRHIPENSNLHVHRYEKLHSHRTAVAGHEGIIGALPRIVTCGLYTSFQLQFIFAASVAALIYHLFRLNTIRSEILTVVIWLRIVWLLTTLLNLQPANFRTELLKNDVFWHMTPCNLVERVPSLRRNLLLLSSG
jgi:hypothetical protein